MSMFLYHDSFNDTVTWQIFKLLTIFFENMKYLILLNGLFYETMKGKTL